MAHASARVLLRVHHACSLIQTGPYPDIRSSEAVLPKRPPRRHLSSSSKPDLYVVIVTDHPEPSRSCFFAGGSVARPGPAPEAALQDWRSRRRCALCRSRGSMTALGRRAMRTLSGVVSVLRPRRWRHRRCGWRRTARRRNSPSGDSSNRRNISKSRARWRSCQQEPASGPRWLGLSGR